MYAQVADVSVADLSLQREGRQEIELAEHEMAGLMALRDEYAASQPLAGARITGLLHMTVQAAVLVETLLALGADVRWAGADPMSTQDNAAAAVAAGRAGGRRVPVFAWKDQTPDEFWWCAWCALAWPDGDGPTLLVDDGASLSLLLHRGAEYEKSGGPPVEGQDRMERSMARLIRSVAVRHPSFWTGTAARVLGASEQTTTGATRLRRLESSGALMFPAISVNDSVTKSKFDNRYQCRQSVIDSLRGATGTHIGGKVAVVCGYGDVGKGCADALRAQFARVVVTEIDPICAFQAAMDGYRVATLDEVITAADIVITTTGEPGVVTTGHLAKSKHRAIFGNMGHLDNEIDVEELANTPGIRRRRLRDYTDEWTFADGHSVIVIAGGRLMNLAVPAEQASFVVSSSLTNQALAQIELYTRNASYNRKLHVLPRLLDEKVARLHLPALGARLTTLSRRQAARLGVAIDGPYKKDDYRY